MDGVKWVGPWKYFSGFQSGKRGFQPDTKRYEHIFRYAVALGIVLGEQVILYVWHGQIIFLRCMDGNSPAHDCG